MTCQPELVTGHVDGALDAETEARVAEHLAGCADCRAQAEAETDLRGRLRALASPDPPAGLETRLRARLRRPPAARRWALRLLPLAAGLAALFFWLRGSPTALAQELALDHAACFAMAPLPAELASPDAAVVSEWLSRHGAAVPQLPARADGLVLQGVRECPLLDGTTVAHLYYSGGARQVSLFVVPRELRMGTSAALRARGLSVRLLGGVRHTLGVVGDDHGAAILFDQLRTRSARAGFRLPD